MSAIKTVSFTEMQFSLVSSTCIVFQFQFILCSFDPYGL